jgi:hypothetical protein
MVGEGGEGVEYGDVRSHSQYAVNPLGVLVAGLGRQFVPCIMMG